MEQWKSVVGYEAFYEVSDIGRVRSLDRIVNCRGGTTTIRKGFLLKPTKHGSGYCVVGLSRNGKTKQALVHRLILEAFVGLCPDGAEACHFDGNRENNALANLRWGTRVENAADKVRHQSDPEGERNGRAVLDDESVKRIIELVRSGESQSSIATRFGVSEITISHIACGRTWAHLTGIVHTRKRANITGDLVARMKELKGKGMTLNQIAEEVGVSKATAFRHLRGLSTIEGMLC